MIRTLLNSAAATASYQQNLQPEGDRNTPRLPYWRRSTVWCIHPHSILRLQAWSPAMMSEDAEKQLKMNA